MTSDPIREAADDALSDVAQAVRGLYGPRGHDVVIMHGGTALITNAASAVIAEACREREGARNQATPCGRSTPCASGS